MEAEASTSTLQDDTQATLAFERVFLPLLPTCIMSDNIPYSILSAWKSHARESTVDA